MIGWSSYLMSRVMITNSFNVHYYERYVNSAYFSYPLVVLQRTKRMGFDSRFRGIRPYLWPCLYTKDMTRRVCRASDWQDLLPFSRPTATAPLPTVRCQVRFCSPIWGAVGFGE